MALYVAICLLAALFALPETEAGHLPVVGIIWGVSVGLALAHWFAFRVSVRLIGAGPVRSHDLECAAAQLLAVPRNDDRVSLVVIWEWHKSTTSDSVDVTRLLSKAFERLG